MDFLSVLGVWPLLCRLRRRPSSKAGFGYGGGCEALEGERADSGGLSFFYWSKLAKKCRKKLKESKQRVTFFCWSRFFLFRSLLSSAQNDRNNSMATLSQNEKSLKCNETWFLLSVSGSLLSFTIQPVMPGGLLLEG